MSTIRRRNVSSAQDEITEEPRKKRSRLAKVDIFPKPKEDFSRSQTPLGAAVSGVTLVIILLLVLSECMNYIFGWSAYRTELSIEEKNLGHMLMSIDIDFPLTSCHKVRVDLADASGVLRRNITHSLHKVPLDVKGKPAFTGKGSFYDLFSGDSEYSAVDDPESPEYCGPCIIDGDEDLFETHNVRTVAERMKCCNTCEDVESFYRNEGKKHFVQNKVPQCLHRISTENPGCKIQGSIRLKKVRGALIFGPKGSSVVANAYSISDVFSFLSSHRINSLTFGNLNVERFSSSQKISTLDGTTFSDDKIMDVKYLLRIIPTEYVKGAEKKEKERIPSYEYSAKWRSRQLSFEMRAVPSVSFYFDIFPIKVSNVFEREPFSHFLVRLCGIVGGVFVVLGVLDDLVQRFEVWKKRS